MKKNKLIFLAVFCVLCSPAFADDEYDPFIFDSQLGDDAYLPEATISSNLSVEFDSAAVQLNPNEKFAAVADMDIASVYLGMPFEDVQTLFFKTKSLYAPRKKNSIIYTVSKDWRYNLDYECRQQKIVIPDDLEKCILSAARKRGLLYPAELHLIRESTGETVDIYFTSNATDNVVWRVVYQNDVNKLEGASEKFANQRDKKILAFWQGVLDKYGPPNSGDDKWISSDNPFDPMLTAYYGMLDLTDQGMMAADAAKNASDARENFKAKPYSF
ncbi:MAG: hypothetical protein FWE50_04180 [Alphaproteobacteria bacterium]|nr:hypothetical protein [Alphaproteobacteria bacterium]